MWPAECRVRWYFGGGLPREATKRRREAIDGVRVRVIVDVSSLCGCREFGVSLLSIEVGEGVFFCRFWDLEPALAVEGLAIGRCCKVDVCAEPSVGLKVVFVGSSCQGSTLMAR